MTTVQDVKNEVVAKVAELEATVPVETKTMDPAEIYRRNVKTMLPRQLSNHLRRKAKQKGSMMDGAWAIIMSVIYDNTVPQMVDDNNRLMMTEAKKDFGKVGPGIR